MKCLIFRASGRELELENTTCIRKDFQEWEAEQYEYIIDIKSIDDLITIIETTGKQIIFGKINDLMKKNYNVDFDIMVYDDWIE